MQDFVTSSVISGIIFNEKIPGKFQRSLRGTKNVLIVIKWKINHILRNIDYIRATLILSRHSILKKRVCVHSF